MEKLMVHEGVPAASLIAAWNPREAEAIYAAFTEALPQSDILLSPHRGTTLPSLGNQLEGAFRQAFQETLAGYKLGRCPGPGYPDERLENLADGKMYAFEVKAKTEFDLQNTSRMVLMCGTSKLRRHFPLDKPLCHLMLTILYSLQERGSVNAVLVNELRFDFLEPWSLVEERYEASVNPKLLGKSDHLVRYCTSWEPTAEQRATCGADDHRIKTNGRGVNIPRLQLRLDFAPPAQE
jgi:hypothetical protein